MLLGGGGGMGGVIALVGSTPLAPSPTLLQIKVMHGCIMATGTGLHANH